MFIKVSVSPISLCLSMLILLVAFVFRLADAQVIHLNKTQNIAGVISVQDMTQVEKDYFNAANDRNVKQQLYNVERFHLNKSVVENIGSGKYQYALGDINFTLKYFPNHPRALHLLTTIAVLSKNRVLPMRYFERAIALYPNHAITHAQYGWYFVTIGDLDNGIQKLNHAVQMDPKLTAGYVWLAQAHAKKGDVQSAREARERAKELGYNGSLSIDVSK
jgi:predicted Zn-dependent protease